MADQPFLLDESFSRLCLAKTVCATAVLAVFWGWESNHPFFGQRQGRGRHAFRNLSLAIVNTIVLALAFGSATVWVANVAEAHSFGLLHHFQLAAPTHIVLGLVLLDAWMYLWHRANHAVPFLWRFHRVHHSDPHMDVTTATRFHLGEHVGSATLRLGVIPLLGVEIWTVVLYDTLVLAVTQLHHADITLGRADRWLRWLIVTPDVHKVHHSDWRPETDSNFSTVFSIWDRLAGTLRLRVNPKTIHFGLEEFADSKWQTWWSLWTIPFLNPKPARLVALDESPPQEERHPEPASCHDAHHAVS